MSKNKNEKPREVTKRQLSHWQRESRLQRIIMLAGLILIAAIVVIVGTGIYLDKFRPYQATVVEVGETDYSMDYFVDNVALFVKSQPAYAQYLQYMLDNLAQQMGQHQILIEEAAKLGVTVGDDEVSKYITDNKLSSNQAMKDNVRYSLLIQKLQTGYFDQQIKPMEQRNLLAMFLESQTQYNAIKARLDKGEKFTDLAAQLSLEPYSKSKSGDFGWVPKGVIPTFLDNTTNTVLDDTVFGPAVKAGVLSQVSDPLQSKDIGYWLAKITQIDKTNNQPEVSLMLLGSKEIADDVVRKLNAGGDFAALAKQYSSFDNAASNGGEQGFITKGSLPAAIDAVIFPADPSKALALNKLTDVIADTTQVTPGGIWLYQVNEINPSKEVAGDARIVLVDQKVNEWGSQVWEANKDKIKVTLSDDQRAFVEKQALSR